MCCRFTSRNIDQMGAAELDQLQAVLMEALRRIKSKKVIHSQMPHVPVGNISPIIPLFFYEFAFMFGYRVGLYIYIIFPSWLDASVGASLSINYEIEKE